MTSTVQKPSILDRAPMHRPVIAAAILSTISGVVPRLARPAAFNIAKIEILRMVSRETGISVWRIQGHSREAQVVRARFLYFVLARRFTKSSLPVIGRFVHRDHTCVLNAVERVNANPDAYQPHLWNLTAKLEAMRDSTS